MPDNLPNVAFKIPDGKMVLIVQNHSEKNSNFQIHYNNKYVNAALNAGSVATFIW